MVHTWSALDQLAETISSVADVAVEIVVLDHLAHVAEDLRAGGDRRSDPGLETVAEGVEVAVGPDAGIGMRQPGAAEAFEAFENHEAGPGALLREVVGAADARDPGSDDQHVEMLHDRFTRSVKHRSFRHGDLLRSNIVRYDRAVDARPSLTWTNL